MNPWTITGIIVVAIGTLMMVWGQITQSRNDAKSVEKKIDQVRVEIAKAKEGSDSSKVESIQSEFNAWADEFLKTKDQQKVALQRQQLAALDKELQLSAVARPIYADILATLRGALQAYGSRSGHELKADLPELPQNLFSPEASDYSAWIAFGENLYWRVQLLVPRSPTIAKIPTLLIYLAKGKDQGISNDYLTIRSSLDGKTLTFDWEGNRLPRIPELEEALKLGTDRQALRVGVTKLLGAQIVSAEK